MRHDMYKVIVERPRHGGRWQGESHRIDATVEDAPSHEGIRRRHRDRKGLNENLSPLKRFLHRQIGRPWDKVYSEICAQIDRRNAVQRHIHQHIEDFVVVKVVVVDGVLCHRDGWRGLQPLEQSRWHALYVDPVSGLLRRNKGFDRVRRQERKEFGAARTSMPENRRDLSPWAQLHRRNGLWYLVDLAAIPSEREAEVRPIDALRHAAVQFAGRPVEGRFVGSDAGFFGRDGVYARRKRQLSARELRRHGLDNEQQE
ncbi:hypothetical protein [Arenimonas sp.]|uniref:hypothetical protein n=1 Tax=Arenimonas sp. TaxID=1872635 RepID=UPI0039E6E477